MIPSITICVPSANCIEPECLKSVERLIKLNGFYWEERRAKSFSIVHNRNALVDNVKTDFLLLVDSDSEFNPSDFITLYNHFHKKDIEIVGGAYESRSRPGFIHCNNGEIPMTCNDFLEVSRIGLGFTLMKRSVLRIGWPYFLMPVIGHKYIMSETKFFCNKLKEYGIKIFLDASVKIKHITNRGKIPVFLSENEWKYLLTRTEPDSRINKNIKRAVKQW